MMPIPAERAVAHSPLRFLREHHEMLAAHVNEALVRSVAAGGTHVAGDSFRWYWRLLAWDTSYFGTTMIRLENAAWERDSGDSASLLARTLRDLQEEASGTYGGYHMHAEVPSDDLVMLRALGMRGFRLIETRLTYFVPDTNAVSWSEHYPVRMATIDDIPDLQSVAAMARNPYDRYHADPFFSGETADRYLATYAAASVRDLADFVVVPDLVDEAPPGAFFTATYSVPPVCPLGVDHECGIDFGVGRIPLVAVGPRRRGWHLRLLVEVTRLLAERSARVVSMTTQASNGAVIRNCEKVGYRLGRVAHILATHSGAER